MLEEKATEQIWDKFELLKSQGKNDSSEYHLLKNKLIEIYYPIVNKVAKRMHKKLKEVQEDELVSWGTDGLFDAVEKFERSRGFKFETYAMHRVRGSILDNIRKVDWIPRLVRQRATKMDKVRQRLEAKEGRSLNNAEIAERLGLSLEDFEEKVRRSTPISCVSMYSKANDNEGEVIEFHDISNNDRQPLDRMLRTEMFQKLLGVHFTKFERKIVLLHYVEGHTMKEISQMTGYSESRISQMHAEILERLRKKAERNPEYCSDLLTVLAS